MPDSWLTEMFNNLPKSFIELKADSHLDGRCNIYFANVNNRIFGYTNRLMGNNIPPHNLGSNFF